MNDLKSILRLKPDAEVKMHHVWAIIKTFSKEVSDIKSFVSFSGSSGTASPTGAAGYAHVDFEDRKTYVSVSFSNTLISQSNTINIYPEDRVDEFLSERISVAAVISPGSGFTISLHAPLGAVGVFKIKYVIN